MLTGDCVLDGRQGISVARLDDHVEVVRGRDKATRTPAQRDRAAAVVADICRHAVAHVENQLLDVSAWEFGGDPCGRIEHRTFLSVHCGNGHVHTAVLT
jgi:hypothetical protein